MSKVLGIAAGAMRFGAAILVGLLLLTLIQFGLLLGGDTARRFGGVVAPLGFLAVLAFSLRFALVGTPTALDRAAAAATAGLASAALTAAALVSGMVLVCVGLFSMFLVLAGGKEGVVHVFGPVLLWSGGIFAASALLAQGLTYLGVRLYFPRSKAGWVAFLVSAALAAGVILLLRQL